MTPGEVRARLLLLADRDYAKFSSSLIPNSRKMIGVRLPLLRRLCRELARGDYNLFLTPSEEEYFEETMLRGMLIGQIKCSAEQRLRLMEAFVPAIDNWSVCDSFCVSLKFAKENKPLVFSFLTSYLASEKEFECRFGFVMLTFYYIEDDYYREILNAVTAMNCHEYYADIAAAWCLSMVGVNFGEQVFDYLKSGQASERVVSLTRKKICESRQYSADYKNKIRTLKF